MGPPQRAGWAPLSSHVLGAVLNIGTLAIFVLKGDGGILNLAWLRIQSSLWRVLNVVLDLQYLRQWIGRIERSTDIVTPTPVAALAATLDRDDPLPRSGDKLPPLWHWLYFLPLHRLSELSAEGHAKRGGFLPPVPLLSRMWAGGRLVFHRPLSVGAKIERISTIQDVSHKTGRSGELVFVMVKHEVFDREGIALTEEHDIVYREMPKWGTVAAAPIPAPADPEWTRAIVPDPILLFRYSALTFNGHRIHYDRHYAIDVEGYPGLIVHGPLQATLLLDLLRRKDPAATINRFQFRAVKPVFDNTSFTLCGKLLGDSQVRLWVADHGGALAMEGTATLTRFPEP